MTLVDTSGWIEIARGRLDPPPRARELLGFATCGPVLQELLQGLDEGSAFVEDFLSLPGLSDPMPLRLFRAAAAIHRAGRSRGFTVRSSVDCLIAAVALEHGLAVWHRDRDFDQISRFTGLRTDRSRRAGRSTFPTAPSTASRPLA